MVRPYTDAEWRVVESISDALRRARWAATSSGDNPLSEEEKGELRLALVAAEELLESYTRRNQERVRRALLSAKMPGQQGAKE